ncbi:MAG TPA: LamG-like jellyroll fold domain-containing protein [Aquabacterium sp.]|nr:LamG-like jellyroll fold domain-containing protein [Aquabacterium sp.]
MKLRHFIAASVATLAAASAMAAPIVTPVYTTTGIDMLGEINASEYTLDMSFQLDDLSGWRKVVDFSDRTSDAGVYLYWDQLGFATDSDAFYVSSTAGSSVGTRVTLTRDSSGLFSAYVNGALQFSFNDSANNAVFTTTGGQTSAWLLADDATTGFAEQSAGTISSIKVYDHALSAREIAAVPEPESVALVGAGLLTLISLGRRRQNKA